MRYTIRDLRRTMPWRPVWHAELVEVGGLILLVAFPSAVWGAVQVRRDDALLLHMYLYALAGAAVAFGMGYMAGYGLLGLVFAPIGALLAVADAILRIFEWFHC
jgi:hypothetical protein